MNQSLIKFPHLEFTRSAISTRINDTKSILKDLVLVCKHSDNEHKLYRDKTTNEYWQVSYAWNWGAKPYCFLVPTIETEDWLKERYVDPDELLIYVASMKDFLSNEENRKINNLERHVRSLQRIGNLPPNPSGRWFGPYKSENIIPDLKALQL